MKSYFVPDSFTLSPKQIAWGKEKAPWLDMSEQEELWRDYEYKRTYSDKETMNDDGENFVDRVCTLNEEELHVSVETGDIIHIGPDENCWGNAIHFNGNGKVYGHKRPFAKNGDYFAHKMESGKYALFQLYNVKNVSNPSDMFFADTKYICYIKL